MLSRRDLGRNAAALAVGGAGALAVSGSATAHNQAATTVSLTVLYPMHVGARFDYAYYQATHIPLAMKVMRATSVSLTIGMATPAGPPPFAMIAKFEFPSRAALDAAHAHPAMGEVRADIAKFTDIKPMILVGKTV